MRAVRFHSFGDPSVLRVEDVPQPTPKPDEVLIRVHASSINNADTGARSGHSRIIHARHMPMIPGYDVAGEVVACGAAVTAFVPGERVFALTGLRAGGQAEYCCLPQSQFARMPQHISWTEAAAVPLAGLTALQALRGKAHLQAGQRVLINGAAGGVGSFAVQIAKALGCHVTGVCSGAKRDLVAGLGADQVIDYKTDDFATSAQRWDVVFDAAGNRSFRDVWRVLLPRGVMVAARAQPTLALPVVLGAFGIAPRYTFLITRSSGQDLALLTHWIDQGAIRPAVDRVFAMDAIHEAHRYFEAGKTQGKVVVQVSAS
jgi:NADPH:quinone reductase-like Zn-dependent oxidoreductase